MNIRMVLIHSVQPSRDYCWILYLGNAQFGRGNVLPFVPIASVSGRYKYIKTHCENHLWQCASSDTLHAAIANSSKFILIVLHMPSVTYTRNSFGWISAGDVLQLTQNLLKLYRKSILLNILCENRLRNQWRQLKLKCRVPHALVSARHSTEFMRIVIALVLD